MTASLTVIVPTYNGAGYIERTLDSLLAQSVPVRTLIVDDGSTDGTPEVAAAHPLRPTVVRQENLGVAVARNRGLALCETKYVAFLDQDDLWHRSRAAVLIDLAQRTGAAAVATTETPFALDDDRAPLLAVGDGRHVLVKEWFSCGGEVEAMNGLDVPSGPIEVLPVERFMHSPAALTTAFMYERDAAVMAGGCATWVRAADDHVLNACIARICGPIPRIESPLLFYRVHSQSTSTVSPLAAPYLSMLLALRWGRAMPPAPLDSDYVQHLISQLPQSPLTPVEQLSLLAASTSRRVRRRLILRWCKSLARVRMSSRGG